MGALVWVADFSMAPGDWDHILGCYSVFPCWCTSKPIPARFVAGQRRPWRFGRVTDPGFFPCAAGPTWRVLATAKHHKAKCLFRQHREVSMNLPPHVRHYLLRVPMSGATASLRAHSGFSPVHTYGVDYTSNPGGVGRRGSNNFFVCSLCQLKNHLFTPNPPRSPIFTLIQGCFGSLGLSDKLTRQDWTAIGRIGGN